MAISKDVTKRAAATAAVLGVPPTVMLYVIYEANILGMGVGSYAHPLDMFAWHFTATYAFMVFAAVGGKLMKTGTLVGTVCGVVSAAVLVFVGLIPLLKIIEGVDTMAYPAMWYGLATASLWTSLITAMAAGVAISDVQ